MQKLAARWVTTIATNDFTHGTAASMGRARLTFPPRYLIMINKSITLKTQQLTGGFQGLY